MIPSVWPTSTPDGFCAVPSDLRSLRTNVPSEDNSLEDAKNYIHPHQTLTNPSSDPLINTFPEALSAQHTELTSPECARLILIDRRFAIKSYTESQESAEPPKTYTLAHAIYWPRPACEDLVPVRGEFAGPDCRYPSRVFFTKL